MKTLAASFTRSHPHDTPRGTVETPNPERGVLGVWVTYQEYDADRPWAKRSPATRYAQAALVRGEDGRPLLLTTARMVAGATLIEVEKFGRPPRAEAHVLHQDREINLALLAVDTPGFFDGLVPLELAAATPTGGTVDTVRWKSQQFEVSATRVKRVVVAEVYFGRLRHAFLLVQTDVSDGGSAEPVLAGGELVGLSCSQEEQTAWVIPVEVIAAYLDQARFPEEYQGFPVLRVTWQWNMDRALAAYLGQLGEQQGVLVRAVPRGSTGWGLLQPRDILLSLDGHAIDPCGYYHHPRFGRIEFTNIMVDGHRIGDQIPAQVLRQGQLVDLELVLSGYPTGMDLIPLRRGDEPPPFLIAGGLVLLELDGDYLRTWGTDWWNKAPSRLVSHFYLEEGSQTPDRRRIILLSQVFPSAYTIGYQNLKDLLVQSVNGREIDSIEDAAEAFRHPSEGYQILRFYPNEERGELILDAEAFQAATKQTLEDYRIPVSCRLPQRALPKLD